ncbi:DUF6274 family protein [Streptomyces sp. NPDC051776]|uniref:DUF6274 family protein n=1 Tax=Streptomyces sp. NPDC051776 TaxID=3155414 RepID=UPI00342543DB
MMPTAKHETRALLRAHLSAATGYRHLTRHCPICHQLQRLAMEPTAAETAANRNTPEAAENPCEEGREHSRVQERNLHEDEGPSAH